MCTCQADPQFCKTPWGSNPSRIAANTKLCLRSGHSPLSRRAVEKLRYEPGWNDTMHHQNIKQISTLCHLDFGQYCIWQNTIKESFLKLTWAEKTALHSSLRTVETSPGYGSCGIPFRSWRYHPTLWSSPLHCSYRLHINVSLLSV